MTGRVDKFSPRRVNIRGLHLDIIYKLIVQGERCCVGSVRAEDAIAHGWTIDVVGVGQLVDFLGIFLSGASVRLGSLWTPH